MISNKLRSRILPKNTIPGGHPAVPHEWRPWLHCVFGEFIKDVVCSHLKCKKKKPFSFQFGRLSREDGVGVVMIPRIG